MKTETKFIEENLSDLIGRFLKGDPQKTLGKESIFLLNETNKSLHDKSLLSAKDRYCEFHLPLYNFYEVNSTISDVLNDLEEKLRCCQRFVEKGFEYPEDEISVSQILDWLVDDYVTLTGQKLPIFYEFKKFRTKQIRKKFAVS